MKLEYPVYRDKVMGCWAGKNVGGVLGAPFECKRQFNGDVDFYTQDLSKGPVPNDDLTCRSSGWRRWSATAAT